MKHYDVIIVGGGIAGLACARELAKVGKNFLLITENIGGRITESQTGHVNYGAYFVSDSCKNILPFVTKTRRIHPIKVILHNNHKRYTLARLFLHPFALVRFLRLVKKFTVEYEQFKLDAAQKTHAEAFRMHPYLMHLYEQSADDFIRQNKLESVMYGLLEQCIYFCTFEDIRKLQAFDVMHVLIHVMQPIYECIYHVDKIAEALNDFIINDSVISIEEGKVYCITTQNNRQFHAKNIVVATPIEVTKKLLHVPFHRHGISTWMFHVRGKIRNNYSHGELQLFSPESRIIFIAPQIDGTFVLYSQNDQPNLVRYFIDHEIILKRHWNPAFNLLGSDLVDAAIGENIFLAGDFMVCGVEDAFISGVSAANQILRKGGDKPSVSFVRSR